MRAALGLVAALAVIVSCGAVPVRAPESETSTAVTVNDRLYVARADGVSVVSTLLGTVERELPAGIMSADKKQLITAIPSSATTSLKVLDPVTGTARAEVAIAGRFAIPTAYGLREDALSSGYGSGYGRYLVLEAIEAPGTFAVIDLRDGRERGRVALGPTYSFDAIDEFGLTLYLLEHPQKGSDLFNVRAYDLDAGAMLPGAIVDGKRVQPSAADLKRGTMGGVYHATASASGWHFALYNGRAKGPVVHALNMTARWAFCLLDLASMDTHRPQWAILPSANGSRVYAVNAGSGAFATFAGDSLQMAQRSFAINKSDESATRGSAVVTADGSRLYAAGGRGIVVIDAHTLSLKGQYLVDREFTSLMVSTDGTRLYALGSDGAITRVDPGSGRDLGVVARLPSAVSLLRVD